MLSRLYGRFVDTLLAAPGIAAAQASHTAVHHNDSCRAALGAKPGAFWVVTLGKGILLRRAGLEVRPFLCDQLLLPFIGLGLGQQTDQDQVLFDDVSQFRNDRRHERAPGLPVAAARIEYCLEFVHKANILKYTQGLILDVAREVASEYPDIEFEDRIIDATAMQLVLDPYRFDVLVMENMFGDILSDLMAGLVGGLGFAPAGNVGEEAAMFEAVHGSAPDIAGQGIANPTGLLLSACLLLDHVGQAEVATRVRTALDRVVQADEARTRDMGGTASTSEFTAALERALV